MKFKSLNLKSQILSAKVGFISRRLTKFPSAAKGFTLIELLIVITIIGILAVAVLSAINPIEQIRRAQDSGRQSDSAELLNSFDRYYTAYFKFPWNTLGQPSPNEAEVSANLSWIDELINKGEVKPEFRDRSTWPDIYVTLNGTVVSVCFLPTSSTFTGTANQQGKYENGLPGCTSGCWSCLPR